MSIDYGLVLRKYESTDLGRLFGILEKREIDILKSDFDYLGKKLAIRQSDEIVYLQTFYGIMIRNQFIIPALQGLLEESKLLDSLNGALGELELKLNRENIENLTPEEERERIEADKELIGRELIPQVVSLYQDHKTSQNQKKTFQNTQSRNQDWDNYNQETGSRTTNQRKDDNENNLEFQKRKMAQLKKELGYE